MTARPLRWLDETVAPLTAVPRERVRLLTLDVVRETLSVAPFVALGDALSSGDVVVVNDAATLPSSVWATTDVGARVELRLFDPSTTGAEWSALLFGAGDWRTRTELRGPPAPVREGTRLWLGDLSATVVSTGRQSGRLVRLHFDGGGEAVWHLVYRRGRPVQYAHRPNPEPLWAFQNAYAARPWAAEQVSAGRALSWALLLGLRRRGVRVVALTEGAGLSSSGDAALDAALPLPERYEVPVETAAAVNDAVSTGARVVAVGTSVVRALESNALEHGIVVPGEGVAPLILDARHRRRVVGGLLTGIHSPQESHYRLLEAFAPRRLLALATEEASRLGLQPHEAGDAMLVWGSAVRTAPVSHVRWA